MNKPHKHAELIKAWANGAEIQSHIPGNGWITNPSPLWLEDTEYRIKPEEKKPVVRWLWADKNGRITSRLLTGDEQQEHYPFQDIKLEWSRTEFPA